MVKHELTEEVQDIVSHHLPWFIRKSNLLIVALLLFFLSLTWLIHYPDTIIASAKILADHPPVPVINQSSGKLSTIWITNEQHVKKGQPLALIENAAHYNEMQELKSWLNETIAVVNTDDPVLPGLSLPHFNNLGDVQAAYQQVQTNMAINMQSWKDGYFQKRKLALEKDLQYLSKLNGNNLQQQHLQQQDRDLKQKEYNAYELLANEKVIAPLELNRYKSALIAGDQYLRQLSSQKTNNQISTEVTRRELLALEKQIADQHQELYVSLFHLKSSVENWYERYVLAAPEEGLAVFTSRWKTGDPLANDQVLCYIQLEQTSFFVEIISDQKGVGKIKKDQQVLIRAEGYPADEFGYLEGKVSYISSIAGETDKFDAQVTLRDGLRTNQGKLLFFRNGLRASAEIITADRRLLYRFTARLRERFKL